MGEMEERKKGRGKRRKEEMEERKQMKDGD